MTGEADSILGKDCFPWIAAKMWAAAMSFSSMGVGSGFFGVSRNDAWTGAATWTSFSSGGRGVSDATVSLNDSSDGISEE